jgi:hypothetical protein
VQRTKGVLLSFIESMQLADRAKVKCDEIQPRCGVRVTIHPLGVDILTSCVSLAHAFRGTVIGKSDGMYVHEICNHKSSETRSSTNMVPSLAIRHRARAISTAMSLRLVVPCGSVS